MSDMSQMNKISFTKTQPQKTKTIWLSWFRWTKYIQKNNSLSKWCPATSALCKGKKLKKSTSLSSNHTGYKKYQTISFFNQHHKKRPITCQNMTHMPNSTLKSQMSEIFQLNNPAFLVQRKPFPSHGTLSVSCRTKRHSSKTKRIETNWLIPDQ